MEQRPLSIVNRDKRRTGNKSWPGCGSVDRDFPGFNSQHHMNHVQRFIPRIRVLGGRGRIQSSRSFLPQNEFKTSLTDIRSCLNKKERKGRKGRKAKGSKLESVVVPFPPKQNTLALSCLSPLHTLVVSAAQTTENSELGLRHHLAYPVKPRT